MMVMNFNVNKYQHCTKLKEKRIVLISESERIAWKIEASCLSDDCTRDRNETERILPPS